MDALSDDGRYGLTIIAFIGSVFSPYYKRQGREDPLDHCSINVAVYNPNRHLWAMTERGRKAVSRSCEHFRVGKSQLSWDGTALNIDIDERTALIPTAVRGRIRVEPYYLNDRDFSIDREGRHRWRPIAPRCHVEAHFDKPSVSWTGHGYLDTNTGTEGLEDGFAFWDWTRLDCPNGDRRVFYNTIDPAGAEKTLALQFKPDGRVLETSLPPISPIPRTLIWRMKRQSHADQGYSACVVKTLEDTPFYSRSVVETVIGGQYCRGVNESLSGPRFGSAIVQRMLPYRMPRKTR